jgi:outer membrane protein assembly factor BamA
MTMASGLYVVTWRDATDTSNAVLDLLLSTNKVDLYTDTKTPNFDTDAAYSATNELATAGGYTQDTKTVGGTPTYALGSAGQLKYSWSASVDWTSATFTARGMILHTAAANLPFCAVTFGADFTATAGTFSITAHANGIFFIDLVP